MTGPWIRTNEDDTLIFKEIDNQTDRAAALIAVAYLEERLYTALLARLIRNKEAEEGLFGRSRPLGSFSSRIDLGALIGVYEPSTRKKLHTIREIRNEFAHQSKPRNFEDQRIRALCRNIALTAKVALHNKTTGVKHDLLFEDDGTPRGEFINVIKYLLLILDKETKKMPLRVPKPPVFQTEPPPASSGIRKGRQS